MPKIGNWQSKIGNGFVLVIKAGVCAVIELSHPAQKG
jgi:hypothetical protein